NSIVANSRAGGDIDNHGTLSGSHNLIETPVAGSGRNALAKTLSGDPLLGPLQDNGGPTLTQPLPPGSPAVAARTTGAGMPAADPRGSGGVGAVDIGALESSGFTITVTSGGGQSTNVATAFSAPLVVTVTANNAREPVAGGLVTFTPPPSGASAIISG